MAIFASRRVNVDPEPWFFPDASRAEVNHQGLGIFDPRPEFDNGVNPILEAYRRDVTRPENTPGARWDQFYLDMMSLWEHKYGREMVVHARRVLRKLAAFRG